MIDPATQAAAMLHAHLVSLGADVSLEDKAGQLRYVRAGNLFCILKPTSKLVHVGFYKLGKARSKRILHAKGKLPFVPYRVEVEAPGDLDTELLAWLKESYDLAPER